MRSVYFKFTGILLTVLSGLMTAPLVVAFIYRDYDPSLGMREIVAFSVSIIITLTAGGLLLVFASRAKQATRNISVSDGFFMVAGGWMIAGCFTTLPYILSGAMPGFVDAFFESMSGLTTTGASVLTDLDALPRGVMFWRCMTQWIGGMGIIALFVAILPAMGEGSHNLFRAEIPGGTNVEKVTPRIRETAKALWIIYVVLSVIVTLLLLLAGLPLYDAICHAFTTLATGGFSTYSGSIGDIEGLGVKWIFIVFMFIGGASFTLHFRLFRGEGLTYWLNEEFRLFVKIIGVAGFLIALDITFLNPTGKPFFENITNAFFQVVSIATTTGFSSDDFGLWSPFAQSLLICLMIIGGCAGSTSGSAKVIRHLIAVKYIKAEIHGMINPRAIVVTRLNGKPLPDSALRNAMVFFALFAGTIVLGGLIITFMGADIITAFSASLAAVANIGPGLGEVGPALNFGHLPAVSKVVLTIQMLMGRLELFGFLIFFVAFMKKSADNSRFVSS